MLIDVLSAIPVVAIGFPSWPGTSWATWPQAAYGAVVAGCGIAIVFRRRYPQASLAVMASFLLLHLIVVPDVSAFAAMVCLLAAYTTQTQLSRPWRWIFLAVTYLGSGAAVLLADGPVLGPDRPLEIRIIHTLSVWLALTVATLIGAIRRHNQDRVELSLERARLLETEHQAQQRLAAAEERARIAREMHDILGHSLGVISAQAEGARYALGADPSRVDEALTQIGRLSRNAIEEVRGVIDVLHTERSSEDPAPLRPSPTVHDIRALVGELLTAGSRIRLHITGDLDAVPAPVGLASYRIAQEELTNAILHAPGHPILVSLSVAAGHLELIVVNTMEPSEAAESTSASHRAGQGLVGMRERARVLGGDMEAGPDPLSGGWKMVASLPWGAS